MTGAYDPELKLVYWGVGNPSPDWNGDARGGDNLYSCSFLALDGETGKLRWHFQFTPHDTHDWDAAHTPVLFDAKIDGRDRKLIGTANRNAFYYVLDRETGEFIAGQPYAKQTWAKGLDAKGKPIVAPDSVPTENGALIWPNLNGATVWFSPSYSPDTGSFLRGGARDWLGVLQEREPIQARHFLSRRRRKRAGAGRCVGRDSRAGCHDRRDEVEFQIPFAAVGWSVIDGGWIGIFRIGRREFLRAGCADGKSVWDFQTGGPIGANPISFTVDGKQRIAISADRVLYVFGF